MHTFFWWIPDQKDPSIRKRNLLRFNKLRIIPDQVYFNVEGKQTPSIQINTLVINQSILLFLLSFYLYLSV